MADEDDAKKQEDTKAEGDDKSQKTGKLNSFLPWIIMAVIVVVCAGSGFALGRLFAGSGQAQTDEVTKQDLTTQTDYLKTNDSTKNLQENWYYDLEPVVANLNEPGATRYVRATMILEISSEVDKKKGTILLDGKKPLLIDWLTKYLANLTLEDATGARNLKRIQSQIRDAFNEKLFPDAKPQVKRILFKEGFAIQ
ncbi:MAG: flagellar basal body-associated FliL family protein [Planctomycetota bacterium]|jgi:flagellar basal body-associated protein FliL